MKSIKRDATFEIRQAPEVRRPERTHQQGGLHQPDAGEVHLCT
jgi:hypothetical protein